MNPHFGTEIVKYKIKKGAGGFGIALAGGAKITNPVTRETGIVVSDVLHGPAFGLLVVGDIIQYINGIDMTKAEKPQATTILKGITEATIVVKRRVAARLDHFYDIIVRQFNFSEVCTTIQIGDAVFSGENNFPISTVLHESYRLKRLVLRRGSERFKLFDSGV
jgi:hypothetical protein